MEGKRETQSPSRCSQMDQLSSEQQCHREKPPDLLSGDIGSSSTSALRCQEARQVLPLLWKSGVMKISSKMMFEFSPEYNILITNSKLIRDRIFFFLSQFHPTPIGGSNLPKGASSINFLLPVFALTPQTESSNFSYMQTR